MVKSYTILNKLFEKDKSTQNMSKYKHAIHREACNSQRSMQMIKGVVMRTITIINEHLFFWSYLGIHL